MSHRIPFYVSAPKKLESKRIIKYLAISKDPSATKAVLKSAPDPVIKTICNAALNAYQGEVPLTKAQKFLFSKNKKTISYLIDKSKPIKAKRKRLVQKGSGAFIPILLSAVLSGIPALISAFQKKP